MGGGPKMRNRIDIERSLIPYRFQILLGGEPFELEIKHNVKQDLYTVGLYHGGEIIAVEPVIYGVPLFNDMYVAGDRFPVLDIVPWDESGDAMEVNIGNFGITVFLTIDDEGAS